MAIKQTIGISISESTIEWTILCASPDGLKLIQPSQRAPVENGKFPAISDAHQKNTIVAGLPSSVLLMHVFNLPSTDPAEITGMVELQLDKISPYPLHQLVVSYEILVQGDTHTRVLVTGVRRTIVEQLGERLKAAGLTLNSVDMNLLCRWNQLLLRDKVEAEGGEAILIIEKGEAGLVIAENGEPVLFRNLTESGDDLLAELDYSLMALEQEFNLQGLERIDLWSDGSLPELAMAIQQQDAIPATFSDLSTLSPLSEALAHRYHTREMHHLELVPQEWIDAAKNKALIHKFYKFSGFILSAWLILFALCSAALSVHAHQTRKLQAAADELAEPAQAVLQTNRKVTALINYTDQTRSAIEALREISTLLPAGIDLSSFSYKKGTAVTLRGAADSSTAIYAFFDILATSDFFTEIKDQKVSAADRNGKNVSEFSLTAIPEGAK